MDPAKPDTDFHDIAPLLSVHAWLEQQALRTFQQQVPKCPEHENPPVGATEERKGGT